MDIIYTSIFISAGMKFRNKKKSRYDIPAHFEHCCIQIAVARGPQSGKKLLYPIQAIDSGSSDWELCK
jgi:hypothetical protein